MNPNVAVPEHNRRSNIVLHRGHGRWQLLLILFVVIGPMLLASAMYYGKFWVPAERNYHGELIGNGENLASLGVSGDTGNRWQLLVTSAEECASECRELIYLARQIHIGLGRDAGRASHALANTAPLPTDLAGTLGREYPQLARHTLDAESYQRTNAGKWNGPQLWIVDPHGNLVLRYDARANGRQMLNDLRHLLTLSRIG